MINLPPHLSEAKRQQILKGARTIFLEHGFAGSSMERIAKEAGVSKGTLYNYFESKEALFVDLVMGECRTRQEGTPQTVEEAMPKPVTEVMALIGRSWLTSLLDPEMFKLFRIVLGEAIQFPQLGQLMEKNGPAIGMARLAEYLQVLNERGVVEIDDCLLAAEQFFAMCDAGIMRRMQFSVSNTTQAEIDHHVDRAVHLFLRAYAPAKA